MYNFFLDVVETAFPSRVLELRNCNFTNTAAYCHVELSAFRKERNAVRAVKHLSSVTNQQISASVAKQAVGGGSERTPEIEVAMPDG